MGRVRVGDTVGGESDDNGTGGEAGASVWDGGESDDDADPLATPRRRAALRVLAGRRLLAALDVDDEADASTAGSETDDTGADEPGDATGVDPGPVTVGVDALIEEVVARERPLPGRGSGDAAHRRRVAEALRSDHLPALDAADVVAYDADEGTVTYDGDPGVEARLHLQ